jgi:hypothetical protein
MKCKVKIKKSLREQSIPSIDKSSLAMLKSDGQHVLFDPNKLIEFCGALPKDNPDFDKEDLMKNNIAISYIGIISNSEVQARHGCECMGAAERNYAGLNPSFKGSKLGEYLARAVFAFYPEGIMSDRGSVSLSARAMAKRLAKLADIKVIKDPDTGETLDSLDNVEAPKTKSKKDDCPIHTDEDAEILNKVYIYKDPSIDTDALIQKGEEALKKASAATDDMWNEDMLRDVLLDAGILLYSSQRTSLNT